MVPLSSALPVRLLLAVGAMLLLSGCVAYTPGYGYGPGYAPAYGYYAPAPVVVEGGWGPHRHYWHRW